MRKLWEFRHKGHMIFCAAMAYELPILFLWIGNKPLSWRFGR